MWRMLRRIFIPVPDCPLHLICCQLYAFTPRLIRARAYFRHGRLSMHYRVESDNTLFLDTTLATSNAQSPASATTPSFSIRALLCTSIAIACGEVRTATDGVASLQATHGNVSECRLGCGAGWEVIVGIFVSCPCKAGSRSLQSQLDPVLDTSPEYTILCLIHVPLTTMDSADLWTLPSHHTIPSQLARLTA